MINQASRPGAPPPNPFLNEDIRLTLTFRFLRSPSHLANCLAERPQIICSRTASSLTLSLPSARRVAAEDLSVLAARYPPIHQLAAAAHTIGYHAYGVLFDRALYAFTDTTSLLLPSSGMPTRFLASSPSVPVTRTPTSL